MKRMTRGLSLLLLLALFSCLPGHVPGYTSSGEGARPLPLGNLLLDIVDPLLLGLAIGAALLAGGLRGMRAGLVALVRSQGDEESGDSSDARHGSRSLAAAGRGLLWGACVLNAVYLLSFYADPRSGGLLTLARLDYVKFGPLLPIGLGTFLLIPAAENARRIAARNVSRPTRIARVVDTLATFGLLACTLTALLSIFVYRIPVEGEALDNFVLPSARGIDAGFVLWCLSIVCLVASLAYLGARRPSSAAERAGRFARTGLAAGVVVAMWIELAGLQQLASSGGQGNPAALEDLGGRMLVPVLIGVLLGAGARIVLAGGRSPR